MVPARSNTTNGMVRNRDREGEGESVVTVPQSAGHAIAQFPAWVRTLSWLPTETASQNGTALPSRGQQRKPANKCVRIIVRTYISCSSISRRSRSSLVLDVALRCCEWEKKSTEWCCCCGSDGNTKGKLLLFFHCLVWLSGDWWPSSLQQRIRYSCVVKQNSCQRWKYTIFGWSITVGWWLLMIMQETIVW